MKTAEQLRRDAKKALEESRKVADEARAKFEKEEIDEEALDTELSRSADLVDQSEKLIARAEHLEKLEEAETRMGEPLNDPPEAPTGSVEVGRDLEADRSFRSLGENLLAIKRAQTGGETDKRLLRVAKEIRASGLNEGIDSEGALFLEPQILNDMLESVVKKSPLLSYATKVNITGPSNSAKWKEYDEADISDLTVAGGVIVYRKAEADTVEKSAPKFQERECKLETMMGICYVTEELAEDVGQLESMLANDFELAYDRKKSNEFIAGSGVGEGLGLTKASCKVTVDAEDGQDAGSVVYKNVAKMRNQLIARDPNKVLWISNPDTVLQLQFMEFPVGTGGVPVFLPPSGAAADPYDRLLGKPVIGTDLCPANGSAGDLMLVDMSDYLDFVKGGTRKAMSIHYRFLHGEPIFRFMWRSNSRPRRAKKIKIRNSSLYRSSIVLLGART